MSRLDQAELAKRSGLSLETIKRLERIRGRVDANIRTLMAIEEAFERLGITFDFDPGGLGVRLVAAEFMRRPLQRQRSGSEGLYRLIYFCSIGSANDADQGQLMAMQRGYNERMGITGASLIHEGRSLSIMEGRRDAILQVYGSISTNRLYKDIHLIQACDIKERHFSDWRLYTGDMIAGHESLANEPSLNNGFHPELLSPATALGLIAVIQDLQRERIDAVS